MGNPTITGGVLKQTITVDFGVPSTLDVPEPVSVTVGSQPGILPAERILGTGGLPGMPYGRQYKHLLRPENRIRRL
jgi:hypothetical protein